MIIFSIFFSTPEDNRERRAASRAVSTGTRRLFRRVVDIIQRRPPAHRPSEDLLRSPRTEAVRLRGVAGHVSAY